MVINGERDLDIASAWTNLGHKGGGVVAGTAHSRKQAMSRHSSTSPPSHML